MAATSVEVTSARRTPGRLEGLLAAGVATAMAAVPTITSYLAVVHSKPTPFEQDDPRRLAAWMIAVELGSAASVAAGAWTVRVQHPKVATGLAVASVAVLLPFWAALAWLPALVRVGSLAATPLAVAGVAGVALRWSSPSPRVAPLTRPVLFVLTIGASLVHLLGYNPFADPGCARTCDDVRPVLYGLVTTSTAVALTSALTIAAAAVAAAAVWRTDSPGPPRPLVIAVMCCLAALMVSSAWRWVSWEDPSPSAWRALVEPLAVAFVGITVCVLGVRTARTRAAVERLVARLSAAELELGPAAGAIRGVHFALPVGTGWVDSHGLQVNDLPAGGGHVVLSDVDGPVLRLILADRVDPGDVLAGLTSASRLALSNARLTAVARAQLADVQQSQRRIVATADAERRRIERDLHDGAQQRLVGAAFHMRAALGSVDADSASRLTSAEAHVHTAVSQLRRLAHGVFPNVLVDEGLEAAIEELASGSAVPITYDVSLRGSVGSDVTMAAYALIAGVLASVSGPPDGKQARVSVRMDEMLTVRVVVQPGNVAESLDFTDVADRIGAAGGSLTLSNDEVGFVAVAVLPCAS